MSIIIICQLYLHKAGGEEHMEKIISVREGKGDYH